MSYVIRKMQIKTRYLSTASRMGKIWKTDTTKRWRECGEQELLFIAVRNAKWYSPFGRQFGSLLKLNVLLPYDRVIVLLGIYPKELKTCPHENLLMDVDSSFTHNHPNLKATKMSLSRGMGK